MKVVRNQLAEGGRLADAQRSLYDLIWMGVRDKVALPPSPICSRSAKDIHLFTNALFFQVKREQVVTTIGELIEAKTEVANIVVDVLSGECLLNIEKVLRCCSLICVLTGVFFLQLWTQRPALPRRRRMNALDFVPQSGFTK